MRFYISYGFGKPGAAFETIYETSYEAAVRYAASNACGWGFGVETEVSASYVVRLNGSIIFGVDNPRYANRFAQKALADMLEKGMSDYETFSDFCITIERNKH